MSKESPKTIIVEGVDLSGKDTLCLKLSEKYGLDFVHCTNTDPRDFGFYYQTLRKGNVVYSRNWLSELIYPSVFGRAQALTSDEADILDFYMKKAGVKMLVLTCSDDELMSRLARRGEDIKCVRDNLIRINSSFVYFAERFGYPVVDTSKTPFEEICSLIQ